MIAKVFSAIPDGYTGKIVDVEASTCNSLPTFNIVGMANKTVSEARERVRSAIKNSEFIFPAKKVTVNLAPAELLKNGTQLDLPIALSVLLLSQQLLQEDLDHKLFVGELSLTGELRPINGVINIVETAREAGFDQVYVPIANLAQARLIKNIEVIGAKSLPELVLHLRGLKSIDNSNNPAKVTTTTVKIITQNTLDQICGQEIAKRALTIALAGHHNILLFGPPGTGKTMLAKVAANLLPAPSTDEQISLTKIHSLTTPDGGLITERPFRSPHHSASYAALLGGGTNATPGEITLAHHGILFLDELPEFPKTLIDALRQPLEDKEISIARANHHITYPADFILIGTMNPCPCGYFGSDTHECHCNSTQIQHYRQKISGPILDRIDLIVKVDQPKVNAGQFFSENHSQDQHEAAQNLISTALKAQEKRYGKPGIYNNSLSSAEIRQFIKLDAQAEQLLSSASEKLKLSIRVYHKVLKVAQTIADLENSSTIKPEHISEALSLRQELKF